MSADGVAVTEGDGDGDGEWLGLGLDASGVGTGGTGHRQLGAATGAAVATTAAGRRDGRTEWEVAGTGAVTGAVAWGRYASYSGCSTSVRRRDSGTGRVASYRSERHRPPSSRTSQPNTFTLQPPWNSLHCRGAYRRAHGRLMV